MLRNMLRCNLKQILLLLTLSCIALGILSYSTPRARSVRELKRIGAEIIYLGDSVGWLDSFFRKRYQKDVVGLRLDDSQFGDADVEHLSSLTNLRSISFASTKLSDEGLASFPDLPQLIKLDLSRTEITGKSLANLSCCPELIVLKLRGTSLRKGVLVELAPLKKLQEMSLRDTEIVGEDLSPLAHLPNLTIFDLRDTSIGDDDVRHLLKPTHLSRIDLRGTQITRQGRFELIQHDNALIRVDWDVSKYDATDQSDDDLAVLEYMPDLWEVRLASTRITDQGLLHIRNCKLLSKLTIDGCSITDNGLASLKSLRELDLSDSRITDAGLSKLGATPQLVKLVLDGTEVSGEGLGNLKVLQQLREVSLIGTNVTETGVQQLREILPNCRVKIRSSAKAESN
jgi:hypothetical protein